MDLNNKPEVGGEKAPFISGKRQLWAVVGSLLMGRGLDKGWVAILPRGYRNTDSCPGTVSQSHLL